MNFNNGKLIKEQESEIIKLKKDDIMNKEIREKFNISTTTIYKIIQRNGRDHLIPNKKHNVDKNYFEIINTEDKAYWLGFLYGDGCVCISSKRKLKSLRLKRTDENHIDLFKKV